MPKLENRHHSVELVISDPDSELVNPFADNEQETDFPDDLHDAKLSSLLQDKITIERPHVTSKLWSMCPNSYYRILAEDGHLIGYIKESSALLSRYAFKLFRPFTLNVYDSQNNVLLVITRENALSKQVQVLIKRNKEVISLGTCQLAGKIGKRRYEATYDKDTDYRLYATVNDRGDEFQFYDLNDEKSAMILKEGHLFAYEMFHTENIYHIDFDNLSLRDRVLVFATALGIDFDYSLR